MSIETFAGVFTDPLGGLGPDVVADAPPAGARSGQVAGRRTVSRISPRTRQVLHRWMRLVPVAVATLVVAGAGADPVASATALVVWTGHHLVTDRWWLRAACPAPITEVVRGAGWPLLVAALLVVAGVVPATWLGQALLVGVSAALGQVAVLALARRITGAPRVLVVGDPACTADLVARWATQADVVVTACVPLDDRVPGLAVDRRVDAVVVVPSAEVGAAAVRRLGWTLERFGVCMVVGTPLDFVAPHRLAVARLAGGTFVDVASSRPAAHVRVAKALLDRVGAAVLLVLLAPLLLLLMAWVRLDSPGRAIFTQVRIGRDGRKFRIYKLRTMHVDAEQRRVTLISLDEAGGVLFKIRKDPRITRAGRWLRRSSLDELPQLVNVLCGHMSLVGPRPALPDEVAAYDDVTRRRLVVRPGMTGLWQVSGRSDLDWETTVALDVGYSDNLTVGGDLGICLRTVRAVVAGRGAY